MLSPSSVHMKLFSKQSFCLLPGYANEETIASVLSAVEAIEPTRWHAGDESCNSWNELSGAELGDIGDVVDMEGLSEILGARIRTSVRWINSYSSGKFISAHRDASGDAQLLLVLMAPDMAEGGQFWIGNENNLIPLGAGDAVLFLAHQLEHGTLPIHALSRAKRITLNIRLWLENK